jgi:hypothetical protein
LGKVTRDKQADEVFVEAQTCFAEVEGAWDVIEVLADRLAYLIEIDDQDKLAAVLKRIDDELSTSDYPISDHWFTRIASILAKSKATTLAESYFARAIAAIHDVN